MSTVMPEGELVEIRLQLRSTHTVMSPDQPLLKITDRAGRQRDYRSGSLPKVLTQRLRARHMLEAGDG